MLLEFLIEPCRSEEMRADCLTKSLNHETLEKLRKLVQGWQFLSALPCVCLWVLFTLCLFVHVSPGDACESIFQSLCLRGRVKTQCIFSLVVGCFCEWRLSTSHSSCSCDQCTVCCDKELFVFVLTFCERRLSTSHSRTKPDDTSKYIRQSHEICASPFGLLFDGL